MASAFSCKQSHFLKHEGTLTLLMIYSRDTMITVTISSVLVEPNVISRGQNPTLVIFSKKPESQSFTLKIKSEYC